MWLKPKIYEALLKVRHGAALESPYLELQQILKQKFNLEIFYAILERFSHSPDRPRLSVFLEDEAQYNELKIYYDKHNYYYRYADDIVNEFIPITNKTGNIYCIFFNLKEEIREYTLLHAADNFLQYYGEHRAVFMDFYYPNLYIFYKTNEDIKINEHNGHSSSIIKKWNELAYESDEFGYCHDREWGVVFDSYENVEKNYEGSYFYYFR